MVKKRITFMLVVTLISGCGKTFLSRLFRSDHGEFTEILTDFLDAAIRMIRPMAQQMMMAEVCGSL